MDRQTSEWKPTRRDELITLAQYGTITPEQAEAEAKAIGLKPFERQPDLPAFDPMLESRWTILMAITWIAWRDIVRVRESSPGFSSETSHWIFREWNEPVENGTAFATRAGWFLEQWLEPTTIRLSLLENILRVRTELPATWQMGVLEAQQTLWRALSDGHLVAEALNTEWRPVDIPTREWSFLKLFEGRSRDVLKYDSHDQREAFTEVKLRRDDVLRLWRAILEPATVKAETACHRWLTEQMKASPDVRPKSKAAFWTEAEARLRPIAKRQFDRAWDRAVSDTGAVTWSKAGRPPQKSGHRSR